MERNARKVYRGKVVSDKMDKTITVAVERRMGECGGDRHHRRHVGGSAGICAGDRAGICLYNGAFSGALGK